MLERDLHELKNVSLQKLNPDETKCKRGGKSFAVTGVVVLNSESNERHLKTTVVKVLLN